MPSMTSPSWLLTIQGRSGLAQAWADSERAMLRYQKPPAKFSAAITRKSAAHASTPYERQMSPAAAATLPPIMCPAPKKRGWRCLL